MSADRPTSVRVGAASRSLLEMKSRVTVVDQALGEEGEKRLLQEHLDAQIALLNDDETLDWVA